MNKCFNKLVLRSSNSMFESCQREDVKFRQAEITKQRRNKNWKENTPRKEYPRKNKIIDVTHENCTYIITKGKKRKLKKRKQRLEEISKIKKYWKIELQEKVNTYNVAIHQAKYFLR